MLSPRTGQERREPGGRIRRAPKDPSSNAPFDAVLDEFIQAWERGDSPELDAFLSRARDADPSRISEIIYQAWILEEQAGLNPDREEYKARYPECSEALERLFEVDREFSPDEIARLLDDFPSPGDSVGPFDLVRVIGEGAFARVFLARERDLENRLVVVKVSNSSRKSLEQNYLARARHPHIVEVYGSEIAPDGRRLIAMPFLGGATLLAVLEGIARLGSSCRTGLDLLKVLDRVGAPEFELADPAGPVRQILGRLSYSQAAAWIVARLAEALDHAQESGIAHGDLKPSNILLTAEGVPMLLDFNLSRDRLERDARGDEPPDQGGTPAYMSPERRRAFREGTGAPIDAARADIYSLGLVYLEMLRTESRSEAELSSGADYLADREARLANLFTHKKFGGRSGTVLLAILRKALAPEPGRRYARGKEFAEDLDRWRDDLPLRHAPDPGGSSLIARGVRRRRVPIIAAIVLGIAIASTAGIVRLKNSWRLAEDATLTYSKLIDAPSSGVLRYRRFSQWRGDEPALTVRETTANLDAYRALDDPDWRTQDRVVYLDDQDRLDLEYLILENILRHVSALERMADRRGPERALEILDRVLAKTGSEVLERRRDAIASRLPVDPSRPRAPAGFGKPAARPVELYLQGVAAEIDRGAAAALDRYQEAKRASGDALWPSYRAAVTAARIGRYDIAVSAMKRCVLRRDQNVSFRVFLAGFLLKVGELDAARALIDESARLDRGFEEALLTYAYVYEALAQRYENREDSAEAAACRAKSARNLRSYTDLTQASFEAIRARLLADLRADTELRVPQSARPESVAGFRKAGTVLQAAAERWAAGELKEAEAKFDEFLATNPGHLSAAFGRAMLLHGNLDRRPEALIEFEKLVKNPRWEEIYRDHKDGVRAYHYLSLARLNEGKLEEALKLTEIAMEHSLRYRTYPSESHYALARACVVASRENHALFDLALEHIKEAFKTYPAEYRKRIENDPFFADRREEILRRFPAASAEASSPADSTGE